MHLFKKIAQNTSSKKVFFTSSGIFLIIVILRSLGALQFLELTAYDFLFYLRPDEPMDDRIVIVDWTEKDIQLLEEGTISDQTLTVVLDKIQAEKPRIIGLDIIRDLPVGSYGLSKKENQQSYQRLIEIFNSTPNLFGAEKSLPPTVNPPKALEEKEQITAADLLEDADGRIRRAFLFPLEDATNKGQPAGNPGMGFTLALGYLLNEGFELSQDQINYAPILTNPKTQSEIILNPLKQFDGSYFKDEDGVKILVNWRTGKPQFLRVSVTDLIRGIAPSDIFRDRIVLIGNTSVSSSDQHHLPINRWYGDQLNNGVEIHAHIASSIISAALDGRPLIKTVPDWSEYLILLITVVGISLVATTYRQISPLRLYLFTAISGVVVISLLTTSCLIAFIQGYWIPIVPSLLGSLITPGIICLVIYIDKIKQSNEQNKLLLKKVQQTNKEYKLLMKDINHTIQNFLDSIMSDAKFVQDICSELSNARNIPLLLVQLEEEFELEEPTTIALKKVTDSLMLQILELNRQRQNAQQYLNVAYPEGNYFTLQNTSLNDFIQTKVKHIIRLKQSQYNLEIELQEEYDPQITEARINAKGFEKVLENLIDNAYHAILEKIDKLPQHQGILTIKTQKKNNQIKIIIQDNGIGMPLEMTNKIFIPFQTFRAKNQGQGLGLSLVRETMTIHKGDIKVETTEGKGSTFIVNLPNP